MQNMLQPKVGRSQVDRMLPFQQEAEDKPLFYPTRYADDSAYGPVLVYNGFAVLLRRSAIHAQVLETNYRLDATDTSQLL